MLTIIQNAFYSQCAQWLPLVDERFIIDDSVTVFIRFIRLGPLLKTLFAAAVINGFLLLM
jgi:hypothetical protein